MNFKDINIGDKIYLINNKNGNIHTNTLIVKSVSFQGELFIIYFTNNVIVLQVPTSELLNDTYIDYSNSIVGYNTFFTNRDKFREVIEHNITELNKTLDERI